MSERVPVENFPPGEFIREELEAREWTQEVLAEVIGRSPRLVSEVMSGKRAITPETARALGDAFGTSAQLWMNLESAYRLSQVRDGDKAVARRSRLYGWAPVKEIGRRHWIEYSTNIEVLEGRVLEFFEAQNFDSPPRPFRHAARKATPYGTAESPAQCAWLYRAKRLAGAVSVNPYTRAGLLSGMNRLRGLRHAAEETRRVPQILAESGVRFIVIEHTAQSRIDGAAFWLDEKSPVVVVSLRYDRIDSFWFTLIHELMHILNKDSGPEDEPIVDTDLVGERAVADASKKSKIELRASNEAADFLIPKVELEDFIARVRPLYSKKAILGFAELAGVHPGLVVGQLQHREEILWSHSREMLEKVRGIVTGAALTDGWGHTLPAGL